MRDIPSSHKRKRCIRTVTGESTLCTFDSSTKISLECRKHFSDIVSVYCANMHEPKISIISICIRYVSGPFLRGPNFQLSEIRALSGDLRGMFSLDNEEHKVWGFLIDYRGRSVSLVALTWPWHRAVSLPSQ